MGTMILIVISLTLFEVINSVDNAVINAEVLGKMSAWARRWFLTWGIFFGVFVIRGILPFLIIWLSNPSLGPFQAFRASFSDDPEVSHVIERSAPILLTGAGVFMILLFLHWIFLEPKSYGLRGERFVERHGAWFYATASAFLLAVVWKAIHINPLMAFSAAVGSTTFFITHGFKENAEAMEARMMEGTEKMSDWSKIFYLEAIDAAFSIDGVLGAFAFTFSIPLILIGNGIGALVVRQLTVGNIERVKKLKYLKNGAMYSVFILGAVMLADGIGYHIPHWLSPVLTFIIIGYFLHKSYRELKA